MEHNRDMGSAELLVDAFGRIRRNVHEAVTGLHAKALAHRVDADANSIAWLVWHLTRVQDDHVSEVAGLEQVWTAQGWVDRFDLPFDVGDIGYGHNSDEVAAVQVKSADVLTGYHDAVHAQTVEYVRGISDEDLDVIVDRSWAPPVTLGVRLISVVDDAIQHSGQALFVRGVVLRQS